MNEMIQPPASAWTRTRAEAELTGVCGALGGALGIPVQAVRVFFAASGALMLAIVPITSLFQLHPVATVSLTGIGAGALVTYLIAWWALDSDSVTRRGVLADLGSAAVRGRPSAASGASAALSVARSPLGTAARWAILAGIIGASTIVVVLSLLSPIDDAFPGWIVFGFGAGTITAGFSLGLLPLSLVDDARWGGNLTALPRPVLPAVAAGSILVFAGTLGVVDSLYGRQATLITGGVTLLSAALFSILLVPWIRRLWRGMREETERRAHADQRAEFTSHLHDSVLQTLTVIQRDSTTETMRRTLARQQEADLRRWLYRPGGPTPPAPGMSSPSRLDASERPLAAQAPPAPATLREAVDRIGAELDALHNVEIDVVTVGNRAMTDALLPLTQALREAAGNASRHAGAGIQVFCDASSNPVEVYVRDRGPGFDLSTIPPERLGIRESIIGRMARAGGHARIAPAIGGGTEVTLILEVEGDR